MKKRELHLGSFVQATGHHIAAWRHELSQADAGINFDHYKDLAQTSERGLFDFLFVADTPAGTIEHNGPARARLGRGATFEPITLWSALAAVTKNIGFVGTSSTTYGDPYTVARMFASLDHISNGRAAWNAVTTASSLAAASFSLEKHPDHENRYERAQEFVDVVKGLWDSYQDDAFLRNKKSGIYLDANKQHFLNFKGKYFSVMGPLTIPRTPQGHPVIVQAGASEPGRELAARTAEVIFSISPKKEEAQKFYRDVKSRLSKYGRSSEDLVIMPGFSPIVGKTLSEAQDKLEHLDDLIQPEVGRAIVQRFFHQDLTDWDLDGSLPEFASATNGSKSRLSLMEEYAIREKLTLRQLYKHVGGARGHHLVVGTPETIADTIQDWFESEAADGFNIMPPVLPSSLNEFVDLVVPELQKRGIYRTKYEGKTMRENLGLRYPECRHC